MELNEWGDPTNTVYIVRIGDALMRAFKDWKAANEYAEKEYIKSCHAGYPIEPTVSDMELH
jgi:hypothetical protein